MYKLKPCPFCGGGAEIEHQYIFGREYSMVKCKECGAETLPILISFSGDERATEAWNRRVNNVVRCCECKFGVTPYDGWISADDRLPIEEAKAHEQEWPGEYCEFLVMIERGSLPTTLYYDLEENEWFRINTALERETYEVTHWMPLPLPPKGE